MFAFSYENILTTTGVVATVITLILIYQQIKISKRISAAEFTLRLCYDIFHSRYMIKNRVRLAEILIENPRDFIKIDCEAREPLDFFEDVGLLLRLNILDEYVVWCSLGYWIMNYWRLTEEYVKWTRENDLSFFTHFEELYKRMLRFKSQKRHRKEDTEREKREMELFLISEKSLFK